MNKFLQKFERSRSKNNTKLGQYKIGLREHESSEIPLSDLEFLAKFTDDLKVQVIKAKEIKRHGRLPILKWRRGRPFIAVLDPDPKAREYEEQKEKKEKFSFLKRT